MILLIIVAYQAFSILVNFVNPANPRDDDAAILYLTTQREKNTSQY